MGPTILVTGAAGFVGKNLVQALRRQNDVTVLTYDLGDKREGLELHLERADLIYHLAGVNRPEHPEEFESGNVDLTRSITASLQKSKRSPLVVFSSSVQASLDNDYGRSKKRAEDALIQYSEPTGAPVRLYRLPNVFGKWSRPNYNSVVATYCHNVARDLEITISDPKRELELVYIDDVVQAFVSLISGRSGDTSVQWCTVTPTYTTTLDTLARTIRGFRDLRETLVLPDQSDRFTRCLFATYLSYLETNGFSYDLRTKVDQRGILAELLKSDHFGQIFVSRTNPGMVRGNHYHDTKIEKFCVLEGEAIIRFRPVASNKVIEYRVTGKDFRVVDIPPGYAHSIENVGATEMIVLFWANQKFDPDSPDTYPLEVLHG